MFFFFFLKKCSNYFEASDDHKYSKQKINKKSVILIMFRELLWKWHSYFYCYLSMDDGGYENDTKNYFLSFFCIIITLFGWLHRFTVCRLFVLLFLLLFCNSSFFFEIHKYLLWWISVQIPIRNKKNILNFMANK